jgi:hypothetical protein
VATEQVVEQVAEHVAENLEDVAAVTRRINPKIVGYSLGGFAIGVVIGFAIGYRLNRAKIRAEVFRESEEEVEKIREMYRDSARVVRDRDVKPELDEVIEDRGYIVTEEIVERPTRPPVPVEEPSSSRPDVPPGPIQERIQYGAPPPKVPTIKLDTGKSKNADWDFAEELANRTEERPYIIHQDEYQGNETGYKQEVLTWYAGDNVLTDEQEQPIANADDLVDLNHMSRFGHGTDDFNVVFVRNDRLRVEYEICRMPTSYEEEVAGLTNDDEPH